MKIRGVGCLEMFAATESEVVALMRCIMTGGKMHLVVGHTDIEDESGGANRISLDLAILLDEDLVIPAGFVPGLELVWGQSVKPADQEGLVQATHFPPDLVIALIGIMGEELEEDRVAEARVNMVYAAQLHLEVVLELGNGEKETPLLTRCRQLVDAMNRQIEAYHLSKQQSG